MNTPMTELDGFEQMLRDRMHRLADHAPAAVPAVDDIQVTNAVEPRRGRRVAGIGAVIALVAGGAGLSAIALQGAAQPGGADSPEAAVREFADALAAEDLLGMIDVTLPEEVSALRAGFEDVTSEAKRIGLLDDTFALGGVAGLDVTVDDLAVTTTELAPDLVAVTTVGGRLGAIFDDSAFPLGRLIADRTDVPIGPSSGSADLSADPITLVAMQRDGRWYVSVGMSIADAIRRSTDAPVPAGMGMLVEGSASPELAAESFYRRLAQLDLVSASALVAPGEGDVFRRYGSLWLPQAERSLMDAAGNGLSIGLTDLQFERIADADGRVTLRPIGFVIDGTVPASWGSQVDAGMVRVDEWPTVIDSSDGSGVWILEPGVAPPATTDGLGDPLPYDSAEAQQVYSGDPFNSTWVLPDGTIQPFTDPAPSPSDPQLFRIERRDGCTTATGEPFNDILAYGPGSERLDDTTVRSCTDADSLGVGGALVLIARGGSFTNLPPLTLVQDGGEWFVSPIGTIAAQLLEVTRSLPDDVNIIDVPLLPFYAGALSRSELDRMLRDSTDVSPPCRVITEPDGNGFLRTVADPALIDVKACSEALGYTSGTSTGVATVDGSVEAAAPPAVDSVTASTMPATVEAGSVGGAPASTAPATP